MESFGDEKVGATPGDDEIVKLDLGCLQNEHNDVQAVVVMANIKEPKHVRWAHLGSAYVRIIAGGKISGRPGHTFVHHSDGVRAYMRLTSLELKADSELSTRQGLVMGMFFRQPEKTWAFTALMKAVHGDRVSKSYASLNQIL